MIRKILMTTTATLLLAGGAFAQPTPVQEIDVNADLTAIKNPAAAAYFARLPDDLQARIAADLAPDRLVTEGGSKITVDIDALALASSWAALNDLSQSKLTGTVSVTSDVDNSNFDNYTLTVAYPDVIAFLPEGADVTSLTKDSPIYYQAMVNAFADHVVKTLK